MPVAQLDRASVCGTEGHTFESYQAHQHYPPPCTGWVFGKVLYYKWAPACALVAIMLGGILSNAFNIPNGWAAGIFNSDNDTGHNNNDNSLRVVLSSRSMSTNQ